MLSFCLKWICLMKTYILSLPRSLFMKTMLPSKASLNHLKAFRCLILLLLLVLLLVSFGCNIVPTLMLQPAQLPKDIRSVLMC